MSAPAFQVGDRVHLLNLRGDILDTRIIARIEYDSEGTLWAGFLRNEDGPGNQWFHVSEHRMRHPEGPPVRDGGKEG